MRRPDMAADMDTFRVFAIALLRTSQLTFVPDIFEAAGPIGGVRLLQRFAGEKIRFPSTDDLVRSVKRAYIYQYFQKHGYTRENIARMALQLDMTTAQVRRAHADIKYYVKEMGLQRNHAKRRTHRKVEGQNKDQ
jgi:hypothetical protein